MGGESICLDEITANHCEPIRRKKTIYRRIAFANSRLFYFSHTNSTEYSMLLVDHIIWQILHSQFHINTDPVHFNLQLERFLCGLALYASDEWLVGRLSKLTGFRWRDRQPDTRSMEAVRFSRQCDSPLTDGVRSVCVWCAIISMNQLVSQESKTHNEKRGNRSASETTRVYSIIWRYRRQIDNGIYMLGEWNGECVMKEKESARKLQHGVGKVKS